MSPCVLTLCTLLALSASSASAQCTTQPLAALAFPAPGDQFGTAVALQDDSLFVSEPGWPYGSKPYGHVNVFRFFGGQWIYETSILPGHLEEGLGFGTSIVVQGDELAVGDQASIVDDVISGAVFLYRRQSGLWLFDEKLIPAQASNSQFFGASIAMDGDRIAVGGWGDSPPFESGAAWIFERHGDSWQQVAKLKPADLGFADIFGTSVALSGDWLAVGTPSDNSPFGPGGRAYLFHRDAAGAWTQAQVLQSTAITGGDYFGFRTAMQGETLLVGAHLEKLDPIGFTAGAVYDFEREGASWVLKQKLLAHDPDHSSGFGSSLALQGDRLAIGTGLPASVIGEAGSVQIFERHNGAWTRVGAVDAPHGLGAPSSFGGAIALDGTRLAAGCDRDTVLGKDAGQACAFDLGHMHLPFGVGLPGKGGFVPELLGRSCGPEGDQDLVLSVQHGTGGVAGLLLAGAVVDAQPFKGGAIYASEPWRLYPHVLGGANGMAGAGSWQIAGHVPSSLTATSLVVQVIYADAGTADGVSASGGLMITLP
jgi:hypothetical protein